MANYRLSVSVVSRSSGRSAVAAAAYRSATKVLNERDGREHDYSARSGVEATEIIAPDHAPDWAADRAALWNAVEHSEKRKDAQTAREVLVSLPHELDAEQRQQLVRDFVQEQFVSRGMVADIAHHAPGEEGDERNHHAHILLTTREIGLDGFGKKNREWNDKAVLQDWREQWEHHVNRSLERAGVDERVDHRSLKDRHEEAKERAVIAADPQERAKWEAKAAETDREPEPKLGAAVAMERRGIRTAVGDLVRDARTLRDAAKERASEWLERGKDATQEMRKRIGGKLAEMARRGMAQEKLAAERARRQMAEKALAEKQRQELERMRERERQIERQRDRGRDRGGRGR